MWGKKPVTRVNARAAQAAKAAESMVLRSDIGCGMVGCQQCAGVADVEGGSAYTPVIDRSAPVMIPDTNVVLHNINALEDPRVGNVVLLSTVLAETQNRNKAVYARVQKLLADASRRFYVFPNTNHEATHCARLGGESPNDFNDRCIRVAAAWFTRHVAGNNDKTDTLVMLVSHDAALRRLCTTAGGGAAAGDPDSATALSSASATVAAAIRCGTLRDFVSKIVAHDCDLLDRLEYSVPEGMKEAPSQGAPQGIAFVAHRSMDELQGGISSGGLLKGKLRVSESSCFFGEIRGKWPGHSFERVFLAGRAQMNRAVHDDVVAVSLLPPAQWRPPPGSVKRGQQRPHPAAPATNNSASNGEGEGEGDANGDASSSADSPQTEADALARGFAPCGRVIGIVEPRRRPYCGSIDAAEFEKLAGSTDGPCSLLFQPKNNRIPRIRIVTRNAAELRTKRLCVVIDDWPIHSSFPVGHHVEVLGDIGDKDTEAKVILMENDVPHYDFSQAVYDCLPKGQWEVEASEVARRLDLRHLPICSVDPLGCRDIDDALHWRRLPNGHVEVGVHIADVTHFLHEGTAMDEEAAKRSTSVYLVDRRINMLPQLLTENLCSIVQDEDRYAFSILWEMEDIDDDAAAATAVTNGGGKEPPRPRRVKVHNEWYGKTIIRSRRALYYGDAQKMIDSPSDRSELAVSLRGLMRLSRLMKKERDEAGALFLSSQEFKFKLDNDHVSPMDMSKYVTFEANSMIEEWMLFANAAAARRVYQSFPKWTLLRRHQAPDAHAFENLNVALQKKLGVTLDNSSSLALNQSLDRCIDPNDSFFNELVRMLTTRCLKQAQYFSSGDTPYEEFCHYGLAMAIYTHFTSPIRRFADVVVHRQLAAALGIASVSAEHTDVEKMVETAANINYRHEQAQKAGRDSQNLYTGFFLRSFPNGNIPSEDGYVVKTTETHVHVLVAKYGQEGRVLKEGLSRQDYGIFDRVRVRIQVVQEGDALRTRLDFNIIEADTEEAGAGATAAAADGAPPMKKARNENSEGASR